MQFTQVPANTFQTLQINAGIVTDSFNPLTGAYGNILGATTGGLTFNTNPEYEDFGEDIDNVPPNTWQLKRVKSYDPSLSGTFLTISAAMAKLLSGAGAIASNDATHFIPNHVLKESDFDDIWLIGDYSDKNTGAAYAGFVAIHLKKAINTTGFQLTTSKDGKGNFPFDFHAHYDMTAPDSAPFEIYVKSGVSGALAVLTVASTAGSTAGTSNITVSGYSLGSGESYVYATAQTTAPAVTYGEDVSSWSALTSGSDITPPTGHDKITVAVKNSNNQAIGKGTASLTVAST